LRPQRLFKLAVALQNIGDLAQDNCARAHIAQPRIDRELFLLADPQCLIEIGDLIPLKTVSLLRALESKAGTEKLTMLGWAAMTSNGSGEL
jgi:hypothetical protein